MTDKTDIPENFDEEATLRNRAKQLGLTVHHNTGLPKLRAMVAEALKSKPTSSYVKMHSVGEEEAAKHRVDSLRLKASKLVRVQVTCMNPNKKKWQGEIFTAGNTVVGTHSKFVVFGKPWHVPQILLNVIRERVFTVFYQEKINGTKQTVTRSKMIPEFNVVELPPLTEQELSAIQRDQRIMSNKDF